MKSDKNIGIYNKITGQKSCKIEMPTIVNEYNLNTIGDKLHMYVFDKLHMYVFVDCSESFPAIHSLKSDKKQQNYKRYNFFNRPFSS